MGLEAECTIRVGRKTSTGTALLEGETLVFRGDFSLQIPFDRMKGVSVDGGELVVRSDDQEARFEVGAHVADRWLRLIKEPKGLFEKLDVGPQSRVAVVDVSDSLFVTALRERTASVAEGRVPEGAPIIFFGVEGRDALRRIHLLRARMIDTGALWIVRPKGSKAISEMDVLEAIRAAGMVDTKVVSFSKTHTAHKCVIPVELRGRLLARPPILSIPPSAPMLGATRGPAQAKAKTAKAGKPAKSKRSARPIKRINVQRAKPSSKKKKAAKAKKRR
jgi:hypothetical protein